MDRKTNTEQTTNGPSRRRRLTAGAAGLAALTAGVVSAPGPSTENAPQATHAETDQDSKVRKGGPTAEELLLAWPEDGTGDTSPAQGAALDKLRGESIASVPEDEIKGGHRNMGRTRGDARPVEPNRGQPKGGGGPGPEPTGQFF